jgi:hypothetical protein
MSELPEKSKRKGKPDPYRRIERLVLIPMGCLSLMLVCNIVFLSGLILTGGRLEFYRYEPPGGTPMPLINPNVGMWITRTGEAGTAQAVGTYAAYESTNAYEATRVNCSIPFTDVEATGRLEQKIAQTKVNPSLYSAIIQVLTDGRFCARYIIISVGVERDALSNAEAMGSEVASVLSILENVPVKNPFSIRISFHHEASSRTWHKNYDAAFQALAAYEGAELFEAGKYHED